MINLLILSACVVWWVNICPIMDLVKVVLRITYKYDGRLKPFDCCTCLGWWGGLTLGIVSHETLIMILVTGILTSFFSVIIEKLYLILILR
jgi:hypothetical protein